SGNSGAVIVISFSPFNASDPVRISAERGGAASVLIRQGGRLSSANMLYRRSRGRRKTIFVVETAQIGVALMRWHRVVGGRSRPLLDQADQEAHVPSVCAGGRDCND